MQLEANQRAMNETYEMSARCSVCSAFMLPGRQHALRDEGMTPLRVSLRSLAKMLAANAGRATTKLFLG
jgi:hypothetical protein